MNYKRKRSKTCGKGRHSNKTDPMSTWPRWWDVVFHRRPARRRNQAKLVQIMHGYDPDGMTWDVARSSPHKYWW